MLFICLQSQYYENIFFHSTTKAPQQPQQPKDYDNAKMEMTTAVEELPTQVSEETDWFLVEVIAGSLGTAVLVLICIV